jgi:hypothetical protein
MFPGDLIVDVGFVWDADSGAWKHTDDIPGATAAAIAYQRGQQ